ncbi:phage head completion protein [Shewanella sp. SE1]|uniref:phage head completion protein n=1 Tax=Shewanella sp. SE1 TaxID=2705014 RepID=UPI00138F3ACD|nr:head-tail adaptor protein [Shewanella sp. SE1]NDO73069.1 head-tail adaptor protein [Shewanella sp. SE1]
MIAAGSLRTIVYLMRPVEEKDEYGSITVKYLQDKKLSARVKHTNKTIANDQTREYIADSVEIKCRYSPTLESLPMDYKIKIKNRLYDIDSVQNQFYQNSSIVFQATYREE